MDSQTSLWNFLLEHRSQSSTGRVWVKTQELNPQQGTLDLIDGQIASVSLENMHGLKALSRLFLWEKVTCLFEAKEHSALHVDENFNVHLAQLENIVADHQGRYLKIRKMIPPKNIKLKLAADALPKREGLIPLHYYVLVSVVEWEKVSQILDFCPLLEIDILESLIELRKQGVVAVAA